MLMLRTVLLSHFPFIPNQFEAHFDWLLELKPELNPNKRTIMTWQVFRKVDCLDRGEKCEAKLIQPHRAFYLELNEPQQLSQLRGFVKPSNKGTLKVLNHNNKEINLHVNWFYFQQLLTIDLVKNIIHCHKKYR